MANCCFSLSDWSGGGFYIDYLADYEKNRASGKMSNPHARGEVSLRTNLSFVVL